MRMLLLDLVATIQSRFRGSEGVLLEFLQLTKLAGAQRVPLYLDIWRK